MIPDNYSRFEQHTAEQERELARLPICKECKNPIQTEWLYDMDDGFICEDCMNERKRSTDSMIF